MAFNIIFFITLMFTTVYLAYIAIRAGETAALEAIEKSKEEWR